MTCNWEINRSSTPERIFQKIVKEMAQPVGIVLFGADCDLKDSAFRHCVEQIPDLSVGYDTDASLMRQDAWRPLGAGRSVLVTMSGEAAGHRYERAQTVATLRNLGAKTVIGIYAEMKRTPACQSIADYWVLDEQVQRLLRHPPIASEFDYLLIAHETTRVIWSGLTGQIGRIALRLAGEIPDVDIVAGISRLSQDGTDLQIDEMAAGRGRLNGIGRYGLGDLAWYSYADLAGPANPPRDFDVVVDFSNSEVFDQVLRFAVRAKLPLICETSGLSDRQVAALSAATKHIPIFRGNCRFEVKKFMDEAVAVAKRSSGHLSLYENLPKGSMPCPSEIADTVKRRISEATGKTIEILSSDRLLGDRPDSEWHLDLGTELRNGLHCSTVGYDDLVRNVLEVAKVMKDQPVKAGQMYDLDAIWNEIPYSARG